MRTFLVVNLLAAALAISVDAEAEPLGQEIKQILQSELDNAEKMAAKMDLIRSRSGAHSRSKPETGPFLQVIKRISCEGDTGALMRAIDSDAESNIGYVISGRCVINRVLDVIGKHITIASEKSSNDPAVQADELATLVLDIEEIPLNSLAASVGSSILLVDLFLESADDQPLWLFSYANAYLTLYNVGFRGQMNLSNYRGGGIFLFDYGNFQNLIGRQATQSQLAIAATREDWDIDWQMRGGASSRVYGSYNIDFRIEVGSSVEHVGFPDAEGRSFTSNYNLSSGSKAWVVNQGFVVNQVTATSNSTLSHYGTLGTATLEVSPSSFVGRIGD